MEWRSIEREIKKVVEIPFNSSNKYQVSVHETDDGDEGNKILGEMVMSHFRVT